MLVLPGCDTRYPEENRTTPVEAIEPATPPVTATGIASQPSTHSGATTPEYRIDSYQFVFDTSKHTADELLAFLERVDEIASMSLTDFDELNITFILQGPDIAIFARQNYEQNKALVDLAARLDALRVIDMKVCLHDLHYYGFNSNDMPAFIDRVPRASDEMERLENAGYFML